MAKLTPARRKALEWFRDNDHAKFWPVSINRRVIHALYDDGLLSKTTPQFGYVRYSLTDLGRQALTGNGRANEHPL